MKMVPEISVFRFDMIPKFIEDEQKCFFDQRLNNCQISLI